MKKLILLILFISVSGILNAADIAMHKSSPDAAGVLVIDGRIEDGDYGKVLYQLVIDSSNNEGRWLKESRTVSLTSPGGSVEEATKIASLIREAYFNVMVLKECHSACFIIYAAGVGRLPLGAIGLHNPYYSKEYAQKKSAVELERAISSDVGKVKQTLANFGVNQYLVEKMMSQTSKELYMLSPRDIDELGLYSSPWSQTRVTKCDADPAYEKKFFNGGFNNATADELGAFERYRKVVKRCEGELIWRASGITLIKAYEKHYNVSANPKGKK